MYYILYNKISNNLIDISREEISPDRIISDELVVESRDGEIPDLLQTYWNSSILDFQTRTLRICSKLEFLNKFNMSERISARASTDLIVKDIMTMLDIAEFINLDDTNTIQSVGYLTQVGILTSERMTEILN